MTVVEFALTVTATAALSWAVTLAYYTRALALMNQMAREVNFANDKMRGDYIALYNTVVTLSAKVASPKVVPLRRPGGLPTPPDGGPAGRA